LSAVATLNFGIGSPSMMHDGWLFGFRPGHLLMTVVVALVVAALVKYVFFR
jgi:hypothetical protein